MVEVFLNFQVFMKSKKRVRSQKQVEALKKCRDAKARKTLDARIKSQIASEVQRSFEDNHSGPLPNPNDLATQRQLEAGFHEERDLAAPLTSPPQAARRAPEPKQTVLSKYFTPLRVERKAVLRPEPALPFSRRRSSRLAPSHFAEYSSPSRKSPSRTPALPEEPQRDYRQLIVKINQYDKFLKRELAKKRTLKADLISQLSRCQHVLNYYSTLEVLEAIVENRYGKSTAASKVVAGARTNSNDMRYGPKRAELIRRWAREFEECGVIPPSRRGCHPKTPSLFLEEDVQKACRHWTNNQPSNGFFAMDFVKWFNETIYPEFIDENNDLPPRTRQPSTRLNNDFVVESAGWDSSDED